LFSHGAVFQGDFGPFAPDEEVQVPLWLALQMKKNRQCKIKAPDWLTVGPFGLQSINFGNKSQGVLFLLIFTTFCSCRVSKNSRSRGDSAIRSRLIVWISSSSRESSSILLDGNSNGLFGHVRPNISTANGCRNYFFYLIRGSPFFFRRWSGRRAT
jgi:hypothetical protein